jgi:hypothetical protein
VAVSPGMIVKHIKTRAVLCEANRCLQVAEYMITGTGARPPVSAYCYTHAVEIAESSGLPLPPAKRTAILKRAAGLAS